MRTSQSGDFKAMKITHWSTMYEPDAPAMAISRIAWIHAEKTLYSPVNPTTGRSCLFCA